MDAVVAEGINFSSAAELTCADISARGYCLQVRALDLDWLDFVSTLVNKLQISHLFLQLNVQSDIFY